MEKLITEKASELAGLNPNFLRFMVSDDPAIRRIAEDFIKNKFIPLMLKLIEEGKAEGYIHHDISNEVILFYINLFREGKHSDAFLNLEHSQRLLKDITTLFFYGIIGKPDGSVEKN